MIYKIKLSIFTLFDSKEKKVQCSAVELFDQINHILFFFQNLKNDILNGTSLTTLQQHARPFKNKHFL